MKRVLQILFGAGLATGLAVLPAHAQGAEFSIGGGVGLPLGDFDDVANTGWHGLAGVSFVPAGSPVGFQIDGQFQQYNRSGPSDLKDRFLIGTANVVFKFNTAEGTRFRPYLIGGGGVYNLKVTGQDDVGGVLDPDGSTTDFGINAGAGFDFKLGGVGAFVEGRFHNVFADDNVNFIPITAGIRLGGN